MNALFTTVKQTAVRRLHTTTSSVPPLSKYAYSFHRSWLSDPSTYPLIVIMGCTLAFMTGMGLHALTYDGMYFNPKNRHETMKTWSPKDSSSFARRATAYNNRHRHPQWRTPYDQNMPEGLGINHKEWLKNKQNEQNNMSTQRLSNSC